MSASSSSPVPCVRSEHLKFDVDAWSYRDFDHGVTLPLLMKNGHEIGQKMAHELWEQAAE